jgi:hypothetical protein
MSVSNFFPLDPLCRIACRRVEHGFKALTVSKGASFKGCMSSHQACGRKSYTWFVITVET